jgi:hypothetical protein
MRRFCVAILSLILSIIFVAPALRAGSTPSSLFQPDPRSVQRYGTAYRYPQAGWIVLHVEGEPYERGYQQGRLLAPEIEAYVRCFAALQSSKSPADGWKLTRALINSLFVRRYEAEFLEEMKGIADGANAAGARFYDRPLDVVDIIGLNSWPEIETLDSALEATPTGLEGLKLPNPVVRATPPPKPMHCSAFAATGPATADGKIVFGHITMFGLYPSTFFNVWLDVQPAKGHRVLMQSYPGGIQSGLDYYLNDAGLLVCETTIEQTRFEGKGMTVASRIRKALQYADSIDRAVQILQEGNNGLYTNEWLLADIKTNEIAMFELGTAKSRLYRSGKNEWFGGTEGFYWGCNNTKDLDVRLETIPGVNAQPGNMVFCPSDRDKVWQRLFAKWKGKINEDFGKEAFTTPPLAAYHSVDAKFTTTDMAKELKSWALFGPPLGRSWQPTRDEQQKYPDVRALVTNPWTVLHTEPPARANDKAAAAVDLQKQHEDDADKAIKLPEDRPWQSGPAWHGTLLPRTDADIWLATAFADYERIVATEKARRLASTENRLSDEDRDRQAVALYGSRSGYLAAARAASDVPLAKTRSEIGRDEWYHVAAGKGVLLLHELRQVLGEDAFAEMMDSFGRAHAGKEVTAAEFQTHVEAAAKKPLKDFFAYWLQQPGLPALELHKTTITPQQGPAAGFRIEGELGRAAAAQAALPPTVVEITVETAKGEVTKRVKLDGATSGFVIETEAFPRRLIVDKYGGTAKANGGAYALRSFAAELDQCLIVYGTGDEVAANREAAESLQRAIIQRWSNYTVPLKSDKEVTDEELKTHHLLLIGRPDCNPVVERARATLPVQFGSRSFVARGDAYAHPDSAVLAAGTNPLNPRYSVLVVAGLSAAATLRSAPRVMQDNQLSGEVAVLAHGASPRAMVVPPRELVHDFAER